MTKTGKSFPDVGQPLADLIGKLLRLRFICFLILSLLLIGGSASAAVRVEGLVDRQQVGVGEEFVFQVAVISDDDVELEEPTIPAMQGLRVVNTSQSNSTSSNMKVGPNGWQIETSKRIEFNYMIVALKAGRLTIPPFEVRTKADALRTKPVTIIVVEAGQANQGQQRGRQGLRGQMPPTAVSPDDLLDDPDELFRQLLARRMGAAPAHNDLPTNPNEVLFIQTEVDKKEVYEGEQVTVNWSILVRGNLLSLDRTKFPDLKGFWKEIIEEVPALQFGQEVINGQVYRKALLASHALFPIKAGTSIIDEYRIKGRVQVPTTGFGGGQDYSFTRASDRVLIKVLPLPLEGRPQDFSGAVGLFTVQAQLDNNIVTANQPMSLKIRFEGSGNAKLIEMPAIDWPAEIEVAEVKSESRFFKNGQSFKQFEFILVPRTAGDIMTPAISISLFNPEKKEYYTRTIEPLQLKVLPGGSATAITSSRVGEKKSEVAVRVPALPAPILQMESSFRPFRGSTGWSLVLALYALAFVILGARGLKIAMGRVQSKDLYKVLQKKVRQAEEFASKGDFRQTGVLMINLFAEILGDLSGQGGSHKEVEKMLDLGPPSLRRLHGPQILEQLHVFQSLSFAPDEMLKTGRTPVELQKRVKEAQKLLRTLVNESGGEHKS